MRQTLAEPPDVYTRIHAALPHARAILATSGIDPRSADIDEHFVAAAGFELPGMSNALCTAVTRYCDEVFILGVAMGLLLDRAALDAPLKGGA